MNEALMLYTLACVAVVVLAGLAAWAVIWLSARWGL
jgi:hypothetical protein